MKRSSAAVVLVLGCAASLAVAQSVPPGRGAATQAAAPVTAAVGDVKRDMIEVPVRRVVLFSSGVGFFQHSGKISGNAATELRFKTDQINDILKTLVVSDTVGAVKSITYGSQNPISRTLRSFQIDISSNPSLANILNQIRGTKISATLGEGNVEGTVLGVEEKERPLGPADKPEERKIVKISYVNLITSTGIRSVSLDDVRKLEIQDESLQKELDQALAALSQARDKDKKPVIVNFDGDADRQVTLAYLVETPVWKTSYRMILPDAASQEKNAALVAWAIVENQTDNDWNGVTLDLVGGRPISFIQDLYQPLYVPRPRVAIKTYASLTPQTYEEGIEAAKDMLTPTTAMPGGAGRGGAGGRGGGGGATGTSGLVSGAMGGGGMGGMPANMPAEPPMDFTQGIRSIADASKVGEMFQYSVKGVSLPRQRSSMIPIITEAVLFDRLSIYNRSVLARNPLLGVRLKNETKNYLLSGPVAVLDKIKRADGSIVDSYAGDATIDDVPAGQERLLSYAVDQELLVDASKRDTKSALVTASILKGVMKLNYTETINQEYTLENKGERDKQLLIEHPISQGYDLKTPAKAREKTDRLYRFEIAVPAKKSIPFNVLEERPRGESITLFTADPGTLVSYSTNTVIPSSVKAVLAKAATKRQAMVDVQRKLTQRNADKNRNDQEQANIRNNISVLPAGSDSRNDQIKELNAKYEDGKTIAKDIDSLTKDVEKARAELEAYLSDTNVQ